MQSFFKGIKTIAIVGLSDKPDRPSYEVAEYLQEEGFTIIPVNPKVEEVLGEKSYPDILSIPRDILIDVVNIFRRSEEVMPHIEEAVARGDVMTIWLQEGVSNDEAERFAKNHGLHVVSNFCLMKAHKNHGKEKLPN